MWICNILDWQKSITLVKGKSIILEIPLLSEYQNLSLHLYN